MSGSRGSTASGSCPLADPRGRLAFWICFMYGLLEIGLAANADVIDVGQVCEPKVTKVRPAWRHPKVDMRVESSAAARARKCHPDRSRRCGKPRARHAVRRRSDQVAGQDLP